VNNAAQFGRVALREPRRARRILDAFVCNDGVPLERLALAGFEAPVRLIDDVDAAFAPDDAIVAVPATQRFQ
jgi:hypothetical protein